MKTLLWTAAAAFAATCGVVLWRRRRPRVAAALNGARARVRRVRNRLARAVRERPRRRSFSLGGRRS